MLRRFNRPLYKTVQPYTCLIKSIVRKDIKFISTSIKFQQNLDLDRYIGQPSHFTHPHLVQPNEICAGTSFDILEQRRKNLISTIDEHSIVIVFGSNLKYKSSNIFFNFHQNPNLLYLTGFNQPNSILLLIKDSSLERGYRMVFFVVEDTKELKLWEGKKCGTVQAKEYFKADEAYDITTFLTRIKPILSEVKGNANIYIDLPSKLETQTLEYNFTNLLSQMKVTSKTRKLNKKIENLRVIKDKEELNLIKKSNQATAQAFISNFELCGEYIKNNQVLTEKVLMDNFEHEVRKLDGQGHAYVPVVAAGKNALALHYVSNDCIIKEDELVMMDAGAFYHGYNTDVTRTWPVSGKFTEAQKALYNVVLHVQKESIKMCHYDNGLSLNEILQKSIDLMYAGLTKIGFNITKYELINQLYPHHVAHYLGLDVHDTPTVSRNQRLQPGNLVTIEPGVYIPNEDKYPEQFRNLGVRIEDNILITDSEPIVLTSMIPKEVSDLEFTIQGNRVQKKVPKV